MRNTAKVLFMVMVLTFVLSLPVLANPFSDVPQDHWAFDAVQLLEEKGLVEGYPDGLFKGDRAMTRYEMAMVVARVIAKLEQVEASIPKMPDLSIYATKEDLATLQKLVDEFKNELDALGVRVNNIEDSLGKLTSRVDELERVKISGDFESIAAGVGIWENPSGALNLGPGYVNAAGVTQGDFDRFAGSTFMNTQMGTSYWPAGAANGYGTNTIAIGGQPGSTITAAVLPSALAGTPQFALNQGFAFTSKLDFTVTAKISDIVKAGGDLVAYSAFGDAAVYNTFGVVPPYNTIGGVAAGGPTGGNLNFQANLATLWFDSTASKNWSFVGKFGNYNLSKVSKNIFYGVRNPYYTYYEKDVLPLNGLNFTGRLYETIDVEVFMAQDVNWVSNGQSSFYSLHDPLNTATTSTWGFAPLYRNYLLGGWAGYDTLEKRLHIEGSVMRLWEDRTSDVAGYATNSAATGALANAPQDQIMYGFKAHYNWPNDLLTIYGEFGGTAYNANLVDLTTRSNGYLFQIGVKSNVFDKKLDFYGEYVRTTAKYDPLGYHQTWERAYDDGFHNNWDDMSGFGQAVRPGKFRPNRHGFDGGLTYHLAAGEVFGRFTYLQQVDPTYRASGVNTDQTFNFIGQVAGTYNGLGDVMMGMSGLGLTVNGNAALGTNAYNFMGNQDYFFTFNDVAKGSEFFVKVGGKYDFGGNFHVFGDWNYMKFNRDYSLPTTATLAAWSAANPNYARVNQDGYSVAQVLAGASTASFGVTSLSNNFVHLGVTYDVTEKFSIQGNFAYAKAGGIDDTGYNQDNSTVIPGFALKYDFNDVTSLGVDYKYYSFTDNRQTANNYSAQRIVTRLNVKF